METRLRSRGGRLFGLASTIEEPSTSAKMKRRMAQIEESIQGYLAAMDSADRAEPEAAKTGRTGKAT